LGQDDYEAEQTQIIYEQFMKQPEIVQTVSGPLAVRQKDPETYAWWRRMEDQKEQMRQMMQQMQSMMGQMQPQGPPPGPPPPELGMGGAPMPAPGLDSTVIPPDMQAVTGIPGAGDPAAIQALLAATNGMPPEGY
ncbi:MAG TPA: hypothetical protein VF104_07090, partial [Burkholderiales bacterium]